jgi:hypothetical protein
VKWATFPWPLSWFLPSISGEQQHLLLSPKGALGLLTLKMWMGTNEIWKILFTGPWSLLQGYFFFMLQTSIHEHWKLECYFSFWICTIINSNIPIVEGCLGWSNYEIREPRRAERKNHICNWSDSYSVMLICKHKEWKKLLCYVSEPWLLQLDFYCLSKR